MEQRESDRIGRHFLADCRDDRQLVDVLQFVQGLVTSQKAGALLGCLFLVLTCRSLVHRPFMFFLRLCVCVLTRVWQASGLIWKIWEGLMSSWHCLNDPPKRYPPSLSCSTPLRIADHTDRSACWP
jgi:hypothetical protein